MRCYYGAFEPGAPVIVSRLTDRASGQGPCGPSVVLNREHICLDRAVSEPESSYLDSVEPIAGRVDQVPSAREGYADPERRPGAAPGHDGDAGRTPARQDRRGAGARTHFTAAAVAVRRPWTLIVPALLLLGVGLIVGLVRQPSFTATSQTTLQITSNQPAALTGISAATPTEAASVSRAVTSAQVLDPVAAELGLSRQHVAAAVSATPVPMSGNITLTATGGSSSQAVRLVNALTQSLSQFVTTQTNASVAAPAVLTQYQAALRRLHQLQSVPNSLQNYAAVQTAILQVGSLKSQYQNDLQAPTIRLITFNTATSASSDRNSKLALLGIIGLVAGLAGGFALCALRAQRLNRSMSAE